MQSAIERVARVAGRQGGRIAWWQLEPIAVHDMTIVRWTDSGYLTRVLPRVYAVGHTAPSRAGDLWAAILYAGPGAMLSHRSAGQHRGIVDRPPARIEVSTPRRIRSTADVRVYAQRKVARVTHDGLPITTIAQTVLDVAAVAPHRTLARALAQLDFRRELDLEQLTTICGHGKPGSLALRRALEAHDPRYAQANGPLEEAFLDQLRRSGLPLPQLNQWIDGIQVDAYWPDHDLVVELDGVRNHATAAQLRRDRANELKLRLRGLQVIRYDWNQVHDRSRPVVTELARRLSRRSPTSSGPAG